MPRQTEPNANNALGQLLQPMLPGSRVLFENTRVIAGRPGLQPDLLITDPGRAPVVIEAEYLPAANVEAEAQDRLGLSLTVHPRPIEAAIALRYPADVADAADLPTALVAARLEYCVFIEEAAGGQRFPAGGWLEGSVTDLADLVRLVSVPQHAVDQATDTLQAGIDAAAQLLDAVDATRPGITRELARLLGMANVPQTRRMACAIIANALVFHERIAGMHAKVQPLDLVCGDTTPNPKGAMLAAWTAILKINYWPIFHIARKLLEQLQSGDAALILRCLRETAQAISATGVDQAHDLTGRIFQRLIADRKYLATFYKLPASAALLARLAVAKLAGVDWSDADAIGKLRVADFACGTGALLSAVYERLAARHERAGGDPAALHPVMMEEVLYGCDVMPSAVHITGATLSGVQPAVAFGNTRLYIFPYGRQGDNSVQIGSLERLGDSPALTLINMSDPTQRTGGAGEETVEQVIADIPDRSFDLVIMNPPFTSNTKHRDADAGVLNAAFAAFDTSDNDQADMADRLKQLAKDTCYHGHAGLASAFAALADKKIRPNGVVALVLPFTAINGSSWASFRELIATKYTDITVVSIAGVDTELSFSSDTNIGECLILGRKLAKDDQPSGRGQFISLRRKPADFAHALELAKVITSNTTMRHLEDGPYGGIQIYCGDELAGEVLDAPVDSHEKGWGVARILDASVAQVAHALSAGELWLPTEPQARKLPMAQLNQVGERGVDHQLLVSTAHKGPFVKAPASPTATYPSLYNHSAKAEKFMVCSPDLELRVKPGMEKRAAEIWETASRAHLTLDFRFTSQPLASAITEYKTIGGTAWPNVIFPEGSFDYPFALWCNSTLGLLLYWWYSSRQQGGRGRMTIVGIQTLPVLDFSTLSDEQLRHAETIFDEFRTLQLQPAYLADADPNRALLDRRVICDLLNFDEPTYTAVRRLAAKWCAEPSVHGAKRRPKSATLII